MLALKCCSPTSQQHGCQCQASLMVCCAWLCSCEHFAWSVMTITCAFYSKVCAVLGWHQLRMICDCFCRSWAQLPSGLTSRPWTQMDLRASSCGPARGCLLEASAGSCIATLCRANCDALVSAVSCIVPINQNLPALAGSREFQRRVCNVPMEGWHCNALRINQKQLCGACCFAFTSVLLFISAPHRNSWQVHCPKQASMQLSPPSSHSSPRCSAGWHSGGLTRTWWRSPR